MKIHAIRGKNLASLADAFEIDFRKQPLASTGLFAISGPTGAGKSTLFDALCIALFDKTPRLSDLKVQGVNLKDVRDETISPNDSRNILRRGAAEGFAEVEFLGNDGLDYLARWSVRRAKGKPDGKLQNSEMIFIRCHDQQRIGKIKKEVTEAIEKRLGLNFQQFTRAVLLAQNEFSAFLKAADNERASLLETLTGTEQYTRLSIASFEREKKEREKRDAHQAQLENHRPLNPDDRLALEQQKSALSEKIKQDEIHKKDLEKRLQWHESLTKLISSENDAHDELERALAKKSEAEFQSSRLALIETLQQVRPSVIEIDRLSKALEICQKTLFQAKQESDSAEMAAQKAKINLDHSKSNLESCEKIKLEAKSDLDLARNLDASIAALNPKHLNAKKALNEAHHEASLAEKELNHKQTENSQIQDQLKQIGLWLEAHAELKELALNWPRWDKLFEQACKLQIDLNQAQSRLATQSESDSQKKLDEIKKQSEIAKTSFQLADEAYQKAQAYCMRFDIKAMTDSRKTIQTNLDQSKNAQALWEKISQKKLEKNVLENKLQSVFDALQKDQKELESIQIRKPELDQALSLLERSLKLSEAACHENVARLRENLEQDCPCPVCGSKDHPFASQASSLKKELSLLQAEFQKKREALDLIKSREADLNAQIKAYNTQELSENLAELEQAILVLDQNRQEQPLFIEMKSVDNPSDWLAEKIENETAEIKHIENQHEAFLAANQTREQALQNLEDCRQKLNDSEQKQNQAQAELNSIKQEIKTETEKLNHLKLRLEENLQELDKALADSDWRKKWLKNPEAFHRAQKESVSLFNQKKQSDQDLSQKTKLIETELAALKQARLKTAQQSEKARETHDLIDAEIKVLNQKRSALFDGKIVDEIESGFEKNIEAAKSAHQSRLDEDQKARIHSSRCQEMIAQADKKLEATQIEQNRAKETLYAWLNQFNQTAVDQIDETRLRQCLSHDQAWIDAERQAIQSIDDALKKAQAVFQERQNQTQRHRQEWPNPEKFEGLKETHAQILKEIQTTGEKLSELNLTLRQDDARILASAESLKQFEAQYERWKLWAKLSELIGSADGKKFRNIAQQLTLDMLLGYANRHLSELTQRYKLERIKETLALQVIDQDMGDEIRSVYSLSGGESFLVSMALALGLASLSSNRVKVESLFIDEGFGSLDADTLRIAMDALDNLQSQGRKVGVISHVQEMTERISVKIQIKRGAAGQSKVYITGL